MTVRRRTSTTTLMAGWLFADLLLGLTIIMLGAQAPPPSLGESVADTARFQPDLFHSPPDAGRPSTEDPPAEEPATEGLPGKETLEREVSKKEDLGKDAPEGESRTEGPTEGKGRGEKVFPRPSSTPFPCSELVGGVRAKPVTLSFRVTPGAGDGVLAAQVRQELRRHRESLAGQRVGMVLTFGSDGGARGGVHLATRVNTAIREAYPRIFGTAVTRNFHDLSAPNGSISMEIYFVTYGCSTTPLPSGSPG